MSMRNHSVLKDLITLAHGVARDVGEMRGGGEGNDNRFSLGGNKKLSMHVKSTNNHTQKVSGFLSER